MWALHLPARALSRYLYPDSDSEHNMTLSSCIIFTGTDVEDTPEPRRLVGSCSWAPAPEPSSSSDSAARGHRAPQPECGLAASLPEAEWRARADAPEQWQLSAT